jgi:hypothetical protein
MKRILIINLLLLNLNLFAVDAETKNTKSSASVQTDRKVACGILLDNSGSLRQQIPQIHGSSTPITPRERNRRSRCVSEGNKPNVDKLLDKLLIP